MINLPMHWSFFHLCLFLGFVLSATYFCVKKPKLEYTIIHQVVFGVLAVTGISEIIWHFTKFGHSESLMLYNLLFV